MNCGLMGKLLNRLKANEFLLILIISQSLPTPQNEVEHWDELHIDQYGKQSTINLTFVQRYNKRVNEINY